MEVIELILRGVSILLTLFKIVYDVRRDKKEAATDSTSDGCATK